MDHQKFQKHEKINIFIIIKKGKKKKRKNYNNN